MYAPKISHADRFVDLGIANIVPARCGSGCLIRLEMDVIIVRLTASLRAQFLPSFGMDVGGATVGFRCTRANRCRRSMF